MTPRDRTTGFSSCSSILLESSTLADSAGVGTFTLECGTTNLSGTIPSGQTVTVLASSSCGISIVDLDAGGVTNDGTLSLDSTDSVDYSSVEGGPLTNNGTFETAQDAGGIRYVRVNATNDSGGTVSIGAADTTMDQTNTLSNAGTLSIASGLDLALGSSATVTLQTGGTFAIAVNVAAGTASGITGGTISAHGTLNVTTSGSPPHGTAYTVVSGSTFSGSFSSVTGGIAYTGQTSSSGFTIKAP